MEGCATYKKVVIKEFMRVKISFEKNWWENKWWVSMYRERQIKKERKDVVLNGEFGCTK